MKNDKNGNVTVFSQTVNCRSMKLLFAKLSYPKEWRRRGGTMSRKAKLVLFSKTDFSFFFGPTCLLFSQVNRYIPVLDALKTQRLRRFWIRSAITQEILLRQGPTWSLWTNFGPPRLLKLSADAYWITKMKNQYMLPLRKLA